MRRQSRIRPPARRFAAESLAQVLHIQARGQALDRIIYAFKDRFLEAFFLDVIEKRREGEDGHGCSWSLSQRRLRVQLANDARARVNLYAGDLPLRVQRNRPAIGRRHRPSCHRHKSPSRQKCPDCAAPVPQSNHRSVGISSRGRGTQSARLSAPIWAGSPDAYRRHTSARKPSVVRVTWKAPGRHTRRRRAHARQLLGIESESAAELALFEARECEPNQPGGRSAPAAGQWKRPKYNRGIRAGWAPPPGRSASPPPARLARSSPLDFVSLLLLP